MSKNKRWLAAGVCALLAAAVWAVFGQAGGFGFINYDDNLYVYGNPVVVRGLSVQGIGHVFRHFDTKFYTPLTMISHMADCQFYGLQNPGGHHVTNILLHGLSAILLFLVLWRMTGCLWPGAFVAAVFAIHPLHVESVAWVSERNDVLAGVFFMLTLGAYASHVRRSGSPWGYLAALGFFVLGLLSKPTLVPIPLLLLLLDWWPLERFAEKGRVKQLLWEKVPFLAFSAAACVVAYLAEGKSVASLQEYPVSVRISNALVSCVVYLRQTVWPSGLVIFYPRPVDGYPAWEIAGALALLMCISVAVFLLRKRCPYLLVGWVWYLVMLAPVIGLVQVGEFAHADRYAYFSQIGLCIALAWGVADLCRALRMPLVVPGAAAILVIGVLAVCAHAQASYWKDSVSIFRHALDCIPGNYVASNNLGNALYDEQRFDDAIAVYEKALAFHEASAPLYDSLGRALAQKGDWKGAVAQYHRALEIEPDNAAAHFNLGNALVQLNDVRGALEQWERSLELQPHYTGALTSAAWVLATTSDDSLRNGNQAMVLALSAVSASADNDPVALRTLGAACAETGNFSGAMDSAQRAMQVAMAQGNPQYAAEIAQDIERYRAGKPLRAVTP